MSIWFASERWAYSRHRGQRWLADVLSEIAQKVRKRTGIEWLGGVHESHIAPAAKTCTQYVRRLSTLVPVIPRTSTKDEEQGPGLPCASSDVLLAQNGPGSGATPPQSPPLKREVSDVVKTIAISNTDTPGLLYDQHAEKDSPDAAPQKDPLANSLITDSDPEKKHNLVKAKWVRAARMALISRGFPEHATPIPINKRQMTTMPASTSRSLSAPSAANGNTGSRQESLEPVTEQREERMGRLVRGLQNLSVSHEFTVHQALVRHLQFSQDGKWLATCSWDRTSHLFKAFSGGEGEVSCFPFFRYDMMNGL